MANKRRFKLLFNREKCKGCELCVSFCPKQVLGLDHAVNAKGYHPAGAVKPEECIGCQSCAMVCPDICISIYELEEGDAV